MFLFSCLDKTDLAKVCKAEDSFLGIFCTLMSIRTILFPDVFNSPGVFMVVNKYLSGLALVTTLSCAAWTFAEVS